MLNLVEIWVDGACDNRVGIAGVGVIAKSEGGVLFESAFSLNYISTSVIAEWEALVAALEYAVNIKAKCLKIYSDSQLIVRQFNGVYRVKKDNLKYYYEKCFLLKNQLSIKHVTVSWISRDNNIEADILSKQGLQTFYNYETS